MKMEWAEKFVDSVTATLGSMDIGTFQPFDWLQFQPLFAHEWVERIKLLVEKANGQDASPKEMARLWPGASSLRCQLYFLILDLKCAMVPLEERKKLCNFFFEMVEALAVEDVFGFRSNILKTKAEVTGLCARIKLEKASPEMARLLGRIYNAAYNLGCGLYSDFYADYPLENEGPYDVSHIFGNGHILVIKRFMGLKPEFWPESSSFPAEEVNMYAVYKDVKFRCDLVSVHSVYEGDPINGLVAFAVEVDGKFVHSMKGLAMLKEQLEKAAPEQWQRFMALDLEGKKVKTLEARCFGMKKLFERVGMDWKPDQALLNAIKDEPLASNSFWKIPEDEEKKERFWRKICHPGIDFFPGD